MSSARTPYSRATAAHSRPTAARPKALRSEARRRGRYGAAVVGRHSAAHCWAVNMSGPAAPGKAYAAPVPAACAWRRLRALPRRYVNQVALSCDQKNQPIRLRLRRRYHVLHECRCQVPRGFAVAQPGRLPPCVAGPCVTRVLDPRRDPRVTPPLQTVAVPSPVGRIWYL